MKKILFLLVCTMGCLSALAQDYLAKGYRGFGEIGGRGVVLFGDNFVISEDDLSSFSINTIHGYQINKYVFAGGGLSIQPFMYSYDSEDYSFTEVAIFLDLNVDLGRKISPFAETRLGFVGGDFSGPYSAAAIGIRIYRVSLSLGLETEKYTSFSIGDTEYKLDKKINVNSVLFNVAVDWGKRNN